MSGFSNSLSHFLQHPCHPNPIFQFIYIQQLHKSLTICLIIRSISIRVSDLQYLQFCNNLWWTDCRKSLPITYPPIYRYGVYPPSSLQWTQIRDFQTRTRTRNPGLTFPKPENPGLQKEPGFGNSSPVGRWSLSLVRFAAAARSTVDCQCAIGQFCSFSWIDWWHTD